MIDQDTLCWPFVDKAPPYLKNDHCKKYFVNRNYYFLRLLFGFFDGIHKYP